MRAASDGALLLERVDLGERRLTVGPDRSESRGLLAAGGDERVATRDEPGHDPALLGRRRGDGRLDASRLHAGRTRPAAGVRHAVARRLDARRDPLVLAADPVEQVEVVEEVGEARRPEHEGERVRAVGHVELAHAPLEPRQRDPIFAAEPPESLRLVGDRPVERSEPRAGRAELTFEHAETCLLRLDTGLELPHPPRDGAQLLREDAGAPVGIGRLSAKRLDLTVDAGLLRPRVAGGGAGREEHAESHQARGGCLEARSTTHHAVFAVSFRVPPADPARSLSSARRASAASRRTTPTTAR